MTVNDSCNTPVRYSYSIHTMRYCTSASLLSDTTAKATAWPRPQAHQATHTGHRTAQPCSCRHLVHTRITARMAAGCAGCFYGSSRLHACIDHSSRALPGPTSGACLQLLQHMSVCRSTLTIPIAPTSSAPTTQCAMQDYPTQGLTTEPPALTFHSQDHVVAHGTNATACPAPPP